MISGVIFSSLRTLVADKVFPNEFPQELVEPPNLGPENVTSVRYPTWPAIRYQILNSDNAPTICGTDNEDTDDTLVQIDVVARTYGAMTALVTAVISALQNTDPPCLRVNLFQTKDEETGTHRGILRYTFYASSTPGSP